MVNLDIQSTSMKRTTSSLSAMSSMSRLHHKPMSHKTSSVDEVHSIGRSKYGFGIKSPFERHKSLSKPAKTQSRIDLILNDYMPESVKSAKEWDRKQKPSNIMWFTKIWINELPLI